MNRARVPVKNACRFSFLITARTQAISNTSQIKLIGFKNLSTIFDKKYIMRRACFGELAPVAQHKTPD
jgi:hypothetical protein